MPLSVEQETVVRDYAQFAGSKQRLAGNVVPGVATSSGTNEVNNVMKTINPKAAGTSGVDKLDDAPNNTGKFIAIVLSCADC